MPAVACGATEQPALGVDFFLFSKNGRFGSGLVPPLLTVDAVANLSRETFLLAIQIG
jgi:hypothetical protein